MSGSKQDPCQRFACALQTCLQAKDYQEWKCSSVMDALYECCSTAGSNSVVCSGIHPKEISVRPSPLKFKHAKIIKEAPKAVKKSTDAVTESPSAVTKSPETVKELPEDNKESSENSLVKQN